MTTTVRGLDTFDKKLRTLAKKYPKVLETVETLIGDLENDQRPGDQIPGVGYPVYKVRLANLSANRGRSGGFRAIYYVQLADSVVLLTIYSKTEQTDISPEQIRQIVEEVASAHDTEGDNS